jgi:hypothetical protein
MFAHLLQISAEVIPYQKGQGETVCALQSRSISSPEAVVQMQNHHLPQPLGRDLSLGILFQNCSRDINSSLPMDNTLGSFSPFSSIPPYSLLCLDNFFPR